MLNQLCGLLLTSEVTPGLQADTEGAARLMNGFMPAIGLILGIIVWITTIGIVVYTAFEIMYVVFPFMQNAVSGEGGEKKGKGLDKMVSGDARRAVEVANRGEQNGLVYYLKHRIIVYIVLGAMIVILVTGSATKLMNLGAQAASGATEALNNMDDGGFGGFVAPTEDE